MVLDVNSKHMTQIPSLPSSARSLPPDQACGIHAIQINPSRTMLATGGKNVNDLAVYKLPTFDPVCVGEVSCSYRITFYTSFRIQDVKIMFCFCFRWLTMTGFLHWLGLTMSS